MDQTKITGLKSKHIIAQGQLALYSDDGKGVIEPWGPGIGLG